MDAREHAKSLVRYFGSIAHEDNREVWQKGLKTAQEWLRLIDTNHVSPDELTTFINVVHANRYRTSGWYDLALGAYSWIKTKDISISPSEVFFAPEGISRELLQTGTPLEHAQIFIRCFEQNKNEDPSSKVWTIGLDTAHEWANLCKVEDVSKSEISILVKKVFDNYQDYSTNLWNYLAVGICRWCNATDNLDLIPDDFHWML